jgi:hypothetical protein
MRQFLLWVMGRRFVAVAEFEVSIQGYAGDVNLKLSADSVLLPFIPTGSTMPPSFPTGTPRG